MIAQVLRAVFSREFLWYLASWRFWLWFGALKLLLHWVEEHPVLRRADLGGFDVSMAATATRPADRTAIVAITAQDVARTFGGRRPIPPDSLLRVVGQVTRLSPAVLVVDVFTDDTSYATRPLPETATPVVWAQGADTLMGVVGAVLGGRDAGEARSGFAAMLAEDDGLVRRVRVRFETEGTAAASHVATLPLAAVEACPPALAQWCRLSETAPRDTASVALRSYTREPAFFTLEDVLAAARVPSGESPLKDRIVVLGFADGSDQLATPMGIRPGPQVVADAIETLLDDRGVIRRMPTGLAWMIDVLAAMLVAAVQFSLHSRPQAAALWTLLSTIAAWFISRLLLVWPGYWTSIVPVMAGMWIEQLLEEVRGHPHLRGPPAWIVWFRSRMKAQANTEASPTRARLAPSATTPVGKGKSSRKGRRK